MAVLEACLRVLAAGQALGALAVLAEGKEASRARMGLPEKAFLAAREEEKVFLAAALGEGKAFRVAAPGEGKAFRVAAPGEGKAFRVAVPGEGKAVCEKTRDEIRNGCMAGRVYRICLCRACNYHHKLAATASIKHDWTYGKSLFVLSYAGQKRRANKKI